MHFLRLEGRFSIFFVHYIFIHPPLGFFLIYPQLFAPVLLKRCLIESFFILLLNLGHLLRLNFILIHQLLLIGLDLLFDFFHLLLFHLYRVPWLVNFVPFGQYT